MYVTIDRFEGEMAVLILEDKTVLSAPRALFPGCAEGDVVQIQKNESATANKRQQAQTLVDNLFRD